MKRLLFFFFYFTGIIAFSQSINNMVVFCNDGEPFTLILNGERINMEPQTRVRVENLPLKKYQAKVVFKNSKLKEANSTITFYSTCFECEFGLTRQSKKKFRIDYFTDRKIEGCGEEQSNATGNNSNNTNSAQLTTITNTANTTITETPVTETVQAITPTNTMLTGPGMINNTTTESTTLNMINGKCDAPMNDSQFLNFKNSIQKLSTDDEKQLKAWAMLEAACITVNQLKQLLNVFFADNSKYEFAKKVYERTKDNSDYIKLKEVFVDVVVKDKFDKFLMSKKK